MATCCGHPGQWSDLGKSVKDLLDKGFPAGRIAFELKTCTPSTVITSEICQCKDNGKNVVCGGLTAEYVNAANDLKLEVNAPCDPSLALTWSKVAGYPGVSLEGQLNFIPAKAPVAHLALGLKHDHVQLHTRVTPTPSCPITTSVVFGYKGAYFGSKLSVENGNLSCFDLASGYTAPTHSVHFFARKNLSSFEASYYRRATEKTQIGATLDLKCGRNCLEFGGKHILDDDSSIKAKVNSCMDIGIGYTKKVRAGLVAVVGAEYNTSNKHLGLGLQLNMEA